MNQNYMEKNIVRYGNLQPCKTAFIDAHTPGSNQKENFTILGVGVSESKDQHVHLTEKVGFNIGAAGQPPKCRNSLHSHRTAEVFFVLKGRWRFFWGRWGSAGEVTLEEGDIFNIPTGIFRGFENIGSDYGMLMAILGGDDAGGGVIWAPQVIQDAAKHGLLLSESGRLYDTEKGESLPNGIKEMPILSDKELLNFPELKTSDVIPFHVARYWDLIALSDNQPANVIGQKGVLYDKPGFEVDFISRNSISLDSYSTTRYEILMPVRGHWKFEWDSGETVINPGDTVLVPPMVERSISPNMTGESSMYRVRNTDDKAGPTVKK